MKGDKNPYENPTDCTNGKERVYYCLSSRALLMNYRIYSLPGLCVGILADDRRSSFFKYVIYS